MDTGSNFSFTHLATKFSALDNKINQESLLQWNLDSTLSVQRFRFLGHFANTSGEYEHLLKDFVGNREIPVLGAIFFQSQTDVMPRHQG